MLIEFSLEFPICTQSVVHFAPTHTPYLIKVHIKLCLTGYILYE